MELLESRGWLSAAEQSGDFLLTALEAAVLYAATLLALRACI